MSRLTHGARIASAAALTLLATAALTLPTTATLSAGQSHTLTVTGRVIDAGSGGPIAGAVVEVRRGSQQLGTPAMTGRSGEFRLTDVPASSTMRALIVASKAGYFGGGADQERPGALRRAFVLEADLSGLTLRLWQTGSISGRVVDSTGAPLPNVFVRAVEDGPPDVSREHRISAGARTDDRGVYEISPVLPETYTVFVERQHVTHPSDAARRRPGMTLAPPRPLPTRFTSENGGFFTLVDPGFTATPPRGGDGREAVFITTAHPNSPRLATATSVTVSSGERRTNVDITMLSVPRVRVRGVVIAPDELLPRLVVQLRDPDSRLREPVALTRARIDGTFEFLGAPPGDWMLEAYRETYRGDVVENDPAGLTARMPLSIDDRDVDDLEIRLQPGVTVSARLEFDGPPPDDDPRRLFVRLNSISESLMSGVWSTTPESFTATGVAPGTYGFFARIPDWHIASVTRGGRDITAQGLDVSTSNVAGLVLSFTTRPTEVVGTVTPPQGMALDGTRVVLFSVDVDRFRAASKESTSVTPEGRFIFRDVVPGEYFAAAVPEAELDDWPARALLDRLAAAARRVMVRSGAQATVQLEVAR